MWHGPYGRLSMCQFRDNIMVATDASPAKRSTVVQMVREVLSDCWRLEVDCECISKKISRCTGHCCQPVTKAVGVVMVLNSENGGTAFAEPVAPTSTWQLKLGAPLKSPRFVPKDYLPAIFTGVLKNSLGWAESWVSQILSAAVWLQVALLSGYSRIAAMRSMHRSLARAYNSTPHSL